MKKFFAIYLLFIIALIVGPAIATKYLPSHLVSLPSWFQAISSVMALIIGFWLAENNRKKESLQLDKNILTIASVAHDFALEIKNELDNVKNEKPFNLEGSKINEIYHSEISKNYAKALAALPIHKSSSPQTIKAVLRLQTHFTVFFPKAIDSLLTYPNDEEKLILKSNLITTNELLYKKINGYKKMFEDITKCWNEISNDLKTTGF